MDWKKKLTLTAALASAATVTLHMINKLVYFSATLDDLLSNPSGSYYEWRFGKIYYTKRGEGKPLLLIHDLSTYGSAYEWCKVIEDLSKTHTVYCVDLLGCGRSDKPNLTYTNYLYVQLITDFVKHIIGNKTDVIAVGESGSFILACCQNESNIIDQVILVNPKSIDQLAQVPTKRSKFMSWLIHTPIFGTFIYNMLTRLNNVRDTLKHEYFYDKSLVEEGMINTFYECAHSGNASSKYLFSSLSGRYTTINMSHCLGLLSNSIYIITGDKSQKYYSYGEKYKEMLPSIELLSIPNTKYLIHLEKPDEFIEQANILLGECQ